MTDGSGPGVVGGYPGQRRQGGWSGRRWRTLLLAAGIAAVTVTVPPLLVPQRGQSPSAGPPPPSVAPSGTMTALTADTGAPAVSTSAPARFTPVSIQARDPGNLLTGGAAVVACATCDGGYRVRYLCAGCQLIVRATIPVSGLRKITVVYETDGPREIKISVNGARPLIRTVRGTDWTKPEKFDLTAMLPAGVVLLTFYNDESAAPDINRVVIS